MKAAQLLFTCWALITVSAGLYTHTSLGQWDRRGTLRHDLASIPFCEESEQIRSPGIQPTSRGGKDPKSQKGVLGKRNDKGESQDALKKPPRKKPKRKPRLPTIEEMRQVLSPEEFESYMEMRSEKKAYQKGWWAARQAKKKGRELTAEEMDEWNSHKAGAAAYEQMNRRVRRKLIDSGRARARMVDSVRIENRKAKARYKRLPPKQRQAKLARKRAKVKEADQFHKMIKMEALRAKVEAGEATEQDLDRWYKWESEQISASENEEDEPSKAESTDGSDKAEHETGEGKHVPLSSFGGDTPPTDAAPGGEPMLMDQSHPPSGDRLSRWAEQFWNDLSRQVQGCVLT